MTITILDWLESYHQHVNAEKSNRKANKSLKQLWCLWFCRRRRKRYEWSQRQFGDVASGSRPTRWHRDRQRPRWHGVFRRRACEPGAEAPPPPPYPSLWAGTPGRFRTQTAESEEPTGHQQQGEPPAVQPTGLERETSGSQEDAQWCNGFYSLVSQKHIMCVCSISSIHRRKLWLFQRISDFFKDFISFLRTSNVVFFLQIGPFFTEFWQFLPLNSDFFYNFEK